MLGLVQGVINAFQSRKANKRLDSLLSQDPRYTSNPFAAQQFALARNLQNARMAGASDLEKNLLSSQGTYNSAIDRGATDAAQALALKSSGQAQTNLGLSNLATQEQQNKLALLQNLNNAYQTMIGEGDKQYNDSVRRYGDLSQIRGEQQKNRFTAVNNIFSGLNNDVKDLVGIGEIFGKAGKGPLKGLFKGNN